MNKQLLNVGKLIINGESKFQKSIREKLNRVKNENLNFYNEKSTGEIANKRVRFRCFVRACDNFRRFLSIIHTWPFDALITTDSFTKRFFFLYH